MLIKTPELRRPTSIGTGKSGRLIAALSVPRRDELRLFIFRTAQRPSLRILVKKPFARDELSSMLLLFLGGSRFFAEGLYLRSPSLGGTSSVSYILCFLR